MNSLENKLADCPYFSKCGGCSLQHIKNYDEHKLSILKQDLVGLDFKTLHPVAKISRNSRRRAVFKVTLNKLSFNQARSKDTIAILNCLLLEDSINKLIDPINKLLKSIKARILNLSIMNSDTGIELLFHSDEKGDLNSDQILVSFAVEYKIARIAWQIKKKDPFVIIQTKPVQLIFENAQVDLPINSFLQVSKESTDIMTKIILNNLEEKKILELYSGCGSFTIPMSSKASIFAVEGSELAVEALDKASRKYQLPIKVKKQDLYQNPIPTNIIDEYSQVVINPPRNGATPQIKQIAAAKLLKKVILVSCSVDNFIRDARILLHAGFILDDIYPIDQFLYTDHFELIGVFSNPR